MNPYDMRSDWEKYIDWLIEVHAEGEHDNDKRRNCPMCEVRVDDE